MNARKIVLAIAVMAVMASVAVVPVEASYGQIMINPVSGTFTVTREFGNWFDIPGYGWNKHTGIDIAPLSSSAWYVRAPADGLVIATGYQSDAGNYIVIRHRTAVWNRYQNYIVSETYTKYYHLSSIYVAPNDIVTQGQVIGKIGATGSARIGGAHLHFEIRENGQYGKAVNPREYIQFGDGKDLPLVG